MNVNYLIFFIIILFANIIQGITGFAGTILAMPGSMMTVGFDVARPVLNGLGIVAGLMVLIHCYKKINWIEFLKIVVAMAVGIVVGMVIKHFLIGKEKILFCILGAFIIVIAIEGLVKMFIPAKKKEETKEIEVKAEEKAEITAEEKKANKEIQLADFKALSAKEKTAFIFKKFAEYLILISAGIIHGMFVSGGPLLITYLAKKIKDKDAFRATISTVWILLNGIIFVTDIINGTYSKTLWITQGIAVPFMASGVLIGGVLYKHMSQKVFIILTYALLIVSAVTLFFK